MPGRVSATPPPAGYRYRHRILYRRAACRGKPEKRKQNGDRLEKIKKRRAVYGRLPPAAPACSAPGENSGPRRPSPPSPHPPRHPLPPGGRPASARSRPPRPSAPGMRAAPAAAPRPPPAPAPASRAPATARLCWQPSYRCVDSDGPLPATPARAAQAGGLCAVSAPRTAPARTTRCGCSLSRRETGVQSECSCRRCR